MKPPAPARSFFVRRLRRVLTVAAGALLLFLGWRLLRPPAPLVAGLAHPSRAVPPILLPVAPADGRPVPAWRRLLAADGSPREDLATLQDLVATLLQSVPPAHRPPLGFDTDLAHALADPALLGDAALPLTHPALRAGRLIDRWGTPWHVHPLSGDLIQLRSAGPDGRLFTPDDLVAPILPPPLEPDN